MPQRLPCSVALRLLTALLAWFAGCSPAFADGAGRVALLVGNANYATGPLANPPNDLKVMEAALKAVGFQVQTVLNANQNAMKRAVRDFGAQAQGAELAFFYYSGHGAQAAGENYLIPLDAHIDREADYDVEAVSANAILRQIAAGAPRATVIVLDACRDNPARSFTRGGTKGLARMEAPSGSMIAFATAPNTTAADDGLYARTLARHLQTPGKDLLNVFLGTAKDVMAATGNRQEPRISEVSIVDAGSIFLAGPGARAPATAAAPPADADKLCGDADRYRDQLARAEGGGAEAQALVGLCFERGLGRPRDAAQAATWYRRAATQGYGLAEVKLGSFYAAGSGVPKDEGQALSWLQRGAEHGAATRQVLLFLGLKLQAPGRSADERAQSLRWLRAAAEQGLAEAQFHYGRSLNEGVGGPRAPDEARAWLQKAAAQGDAHARELLARLP
jgi:uncharacterized caspase-like protein